jgi:hypothetical protein
VGKYIIIIIIIILHETKIAGLILLSIKAKVGMLLIFFFGGGEFLGCNISVRGA